MRKPRAKTPVRRQWKVYRTVLGLNDVVVAAPSEKAALAAWGSKVDLFREGLAAVVKNDKIAEKARCLPGIVLRREHGAADKFVFDTGVTNVGNVITACISIKDVRRVSPEKLKAIAGLGDELSALKRQFKMEIAKLNTRQEILSSDREISCRTFNNDVRAIVSRLEAIHKTGRLR